MKSNRLKTSTLNGKDLQQLPFDLTITYRPIKYIGFGIMEKEIKYITSGLKYDYLYYSWERDRQVNKYHAHLMIKTQQDKETISQSIYKKLQGDKIKNNIRKGQRELIIKTEKKYTNTDTLMSKTIMVDKKVDVDFIEMFGLHGKVYIEPVIEQRGACYYITKSTSHGFTSGFLKEGM
jgi:hypothetical protein